MARAKAHFETLRKLACPEVTNITAVMPTGVHSCIVPCAPDCHVEPGALTSPDAAFTYGNSWFYRLRSPFTERGEEDSQDWELEIDVLNREIATVKNSAGFKVS